MHRHNVAALHLSLTLGRQIVQPRVWNKYVVILKTTSVVLLNVWGEPVFSVMAAGWFCEKSG
jgi:hypothetical protein